VDKEDKVKKERKVEEVKSLAERLEKAKALIFTEYRGLKVSEMDELRTKLRKEKSWFKVVKNRLMKSFNYLQFMIKVMGYRSRL